MSDWGEPFKSRAECEAHFQRPWIECLICGKRLKTVGAHSLRQHSVPMDEYKERFNIPNTQPLCSTLHSERKRDALLAQPGGTERFTKEVREKGAATRRRGVKHRPVTPWRSDEIRIAGARVQGAESPYTVADCRAVLRIMLERDLTLREALDLPGTPGMTAFYIIMRPKHLRREVEAVFSALSFRAQARAQRLTPAFKAEVVRLFNLGWSDKRIAEELGVTAMTSNKITKPLRRMRLVA